MAYFHAINTGKGFITHADNELSHISGYVGDIWVTENSIWAAKVNATEKTKEEAQILVVAAISGSVYGEGHELEGQQVVITLP
jgi:protein-disulfide isomerase-like protein with CxxC motif